ncbi:proline-rich protein 29 isoform 1-T1 [Cyanocitta cristata]
MEGGAAGDPRGLWGDPPAGTFLVPHGLRSVGSPPGAAPVSRPPLLILQQLPGPGAAPAGPPPGRGDLMELMLIQSSQMHQLLMHSLAMAALTSPGVGPAPAPAQAPAGPSQGEEEEEAVVFHHHYIPYPGPAPVPAPVPVRFLRSSPGHEGRAVPPPPPPSATGTVGPGVPPAAEFYSAEKQRP